MKLTIALLLALSIGSGSDPRMTLLDSDSVAEASAWRPVHDRVMGGVSDGAVRSTEEGVLFRGRVSLENNGGFASFRRAVEWEDLAAWDGLRLRVRGDGAVYKLNLRTRAPRSWREVSWQASFATTAGEWLDVDVPFDALIPTWRGRLVAGTGPFDPTAVRELGFLIADKQAGEFALELASVEAWRADGDEPGSRGSERARTRAVSKLLDGEVDADAFAEAMRSEERVLVVAEPSGLLDARTSMQLAALRVRADALAARELRVVRLTGADAGRAAGHTLDAELSAGLRKRWELPRPRWAVALVGKDGGVKARWSEPVDPEVLFGLIDGMPMRRSELRERGAETPTGSDSSPNPGS